MQQTQSDISNISQNTKKANNSKSSLINEKIPNTPFRIYGDEKIGYSIIVANRVVTLPKKTKEETIEQLTTEQWNIIANLICVVIEQNEEYNKLQEKIN